MMKAVLILGMLFSGTQASVTINANANADEGANPIRKIVTLLQDMQKEIEAEGVKEKELYDKFMCFCSGGAEELAKTIADAKQEVETLTGKLEEEKAEKSGLEGDLVKHKEDRTAATADLEKATALRDKEAAENAADLADQETNFGAVSSAIPALEKGMGASSLLQTTPLANLKKATEGMLDANTMQYVTQIGSDTDAFGSQPTEENFPVVVGNNRQVFIALRGWLESQPQIEIDKSDMSLPNPVRVILCGANSCYEKI